MRTAVDAAVEEASDRVVQRVSVRTGLTTLIGGVAGSGRSAVLERASGKLAAAGFLPVVVAPPARQYDSAAMALLDTAVGLAQLGLADDILRLWSRPATWSERTGELLGWLKEAATSDQFVLLIDDPSRWAIPESGETSRRFEAAADLLLRDVDCTRVVATSDAVASEGVVEVNRLSAAEAFGNSEDWGPLAEAAGGVGAAVPDIAGRTPAEIGFVVALAALTSIDVVRTWWDSRLTTEQVGDRVVEHIRGTPSLRRLWAAWLAASLPRRATDPAYLAPDIERIGDQEHVALLERCLLAPGGGRLAREARAAAWRAQVDGFMARVRADAAVRLHSHYVASLDAAARGGDPELLRYAAEALHLACRIGPNAAPQTLPAPFSDQLNAVGIAATERLDFAAAAEAFDLALEVDPDDPLATHYLGYSLDNDAMEPIRVEEAYERALALDGSYATWHSRLICFLVVRARISDARRRWASSRAQLLADEVDSPAELYARLHVPVAAHLLRRAELAMSYEVLDDVPTWARQQLVGYSDQRHRLEVLEGAQEAGSFVPAHRASVLWWKTGPELLSERHPDGRPLEMWLAGGVESVDPEGVHLSVAAVARSGDPRTGTTSLSWEQIRDFAADVGRSEVLAEGDFIEVGYYGHGDELPSDPVIRVLPRHEWTVGIETSMDPARYIRRARW